MKAMLDAIYPIDWVLVFLVGLAGVWRIVRGPTVLDRLLGFDALAVAVCALIAVHSLRAQTGDYMELIIVVTGLGFFTTVAFFYYLSQSSQRPGSIDLNEPERADANEAKGGRNER